MKEQKIIQKKKGLYNFFNYFFLCYFQTFINKLLKNKKEKRKKWNFDFTKHSVFFFFALTLKDIQQTVYQTTYSSRLS